MTDYTTLFEQQSYQDALEYYLAVLSDDRKPTWDYVLLTARPIPCRLSTVWQTDSFRAGPTTR